MIGLFICSETLLKHINVDARVIHVLRNMQIIKMVGETSLLAIGVLKTFLNNLTMAGDADCSLLFLQNYAILLL